MDNAKRPNPNLPVTEPIKKFSFGVFLLSMLAALFVDFILSIATPFVLFAASGFNIHGGSPSASGLPVYLLVNAALLVYAASKGRDVAAGFSVGALLMTLAAWEFIS